MLSSATRDKSPRSGVLPLLWGFAFLSYLLRTNIAVAQQYMARELRFSDLQIGYVFSAFLIAYTLFQVPAGILGDRFGPRAVLTFSALIWGATTLLTGLAPGLLLKGTTLALASLLVIRFLLGVGEAATFPVAMTAVADWFAPSEHAFINSLIFTGSTLGAAFAPPLVAYIMNALGWRATFYWTAILPLVLAALWWRQTKSTQHRTATAPTREFSSDLAAAWWPLLREPTVLFLCTSYFLYCYSISIFVYWLFKYLVDVRHLSIVNSGWATSLPWIVASAAVPCLGLLSGRISERMGMLRGRRIIAMSCLIVSAFLMFLGAGSRNIAVSIGAIALSVGLLFSTESSYWSTAIEVAPHDAGAASGLMNLAGNLGGVASTLLVPVLVHQFGWFQALLSGSVFAISGAAFWLLLRPPPGSRLERTHLGQAPDSVY